jgi:hypothetical protein
VLTDACKAFPMWQGVRFCLETTISGCSSNIEQESLGLQDVEGSSQPPDQNILPCQNSYGSVLQTDISGCKSYRKYQYSECPVEGSSVL